MYPIKKKSSNVRQDAFGVYILMPGTNNPLQGNNNNKEGKPYIR